MRGTASKLRTSISVQNCEFFTFTSPSYPHDFGTVSQEDPGGFSCDFTVKDLYFDDFRCSEQ